MKYVFFGGQKSRFAQIILDELTKAGVPPAAAFRDAKAPMNLENLEKLGADFFLVAAFAKILKKDLIAIPPKGVIGIHPSLLPKYRGPSPIQSTLLADEAKTGTTLFFIDEKVDHGPILAQNTLIIDPDDNFEMLTEKLAYLSTTLAKKILPLWISGKITPRSQNENEATFTKKFTTADAEVDLNKDDSRKILLKIRALNPEPGVFTYLDLKDGRKLRIKLLKARFNNSQLELLEVQPEGRKTMSYRDFQNGYKKRLVIQRRVQAA